MKTYTQTATGKLVKRFDEELKSLLTEDLKSFKERNQFTTSNKQAVANQQLKAA